MTWRDDIEQMESEDRAAIRFWESPEERLLREIFTGGTERYCGTCGPGCLGRTSLDRETDS